MHIKYVTTTLTTKKKKKSHDFCTMTQCFLTGSQFFFTRLDWMTVYYLALIIVAHLFFIFISRQSTFVFFMIC